ncbi:uncharacterized protein LOC144916083 [Branchiostoma floridae x Branchiostoma belcheri]
MAGVRSLFRVILCFLCILESRGQTEIPLHRSTNVVVNSDVELIWTYQLGAGVTPLFESWQKLPEMGIASRTSVAVYISQLYEGRVELFGQAGLRLKNVTFSDEGVYQLFTVFSDGTSRRTNISVQVIDPCEDNDCAPNVTVCVPEGFNFSCRCNHGYEGDGKSCVDINECDIEQGLCANGGTCVNEDGGFSCVCLPGYKPQGSTCVDINECDAQGPYWPCANGGTCVNKVGSFSCVCPPGYGGFYCRIVHGGWSDWVDGDCSATCGFGMMTQIRICNNPEPANGGAECTREDGTTGLTEERSISCYQDACPIDGAWSDWVVGDCSVTCGNGVMTQTRFCNNPAPANGGPECTLVNGTTGLIEERTVPCDQGACPTIGPDDHCHWAGDPCLNGGTCINGDQSFSCQCPPGYGGYNCQTDVDECAFYQCQNGATCIDDVSGYTCVCTEGWEGEFCEVPQTQSTTAKPAGTSDPVMFSTQGTTTLQTTVPQTQNTTTAIPTRTSTTTSTQQMTTDESRIFLPDNGVTEAIDGMSAELHWSYRLKSNFSIIFEAWFSRANGRDEMMASRVHPLPVSFSSKYEGRVEVFGDSDLLLKAVSPADDGIYELMAAFSDVSEPRRRSRTLVVYYAPSITDVLPSLSATEGDQVTLQARANGVPPPTYLWTKINGSLPSNSVMNATTGTLTLLNATLQDSGTYRVIASNGMGNSSNVTILTVISPVVAEGLPSLGMDIPSDEMGISSDEEAINISAKENTAPKSETPGLTTLHVVMIAVVPSVALLALGVVAGILGYRWRRKRQSDNIAFHPDILELSTDVNRPPLPLPPPVPARPQFLEYEVNLTDLQLHEQIGRGAFGVVSLATLKRIVDGLLTEQTVVVKTVHEDAGEEEIKNFIREVDTTINLRQHINLLGLVGCCTVSHPPFLVTEYMPYGDLKNFLLKCRKLHERLRDSMYDFNAMEVYQVARQIANGMTYISQAGYVHGDLAARNVLVGEDLVVKIADFGLTTDIRRGYGRQDAEQKIPLKWMAPERLLREGRYTSKSDVWSFGVVLYEIATLGNVPYPGLDRTLLDELRTGYREPRPPGLQQDLYDMMLRCWQWEEDDRPKFEDLYDELDAVVESMAKGYIKPGSGSPGGEDGAAVATENSYDIPRSAQMRMQLHVTADVYNSEDRDEIDSLASSNVESSSTPIGGHLDNHEISDSELPRSTTDHIEDNSCDAEEEMKKPQTTEETVDNV